MKICLTSPFMQVVFATEVAIPARMEFEPDKQGKRVEGRPVERSWLVWVEAVDAVNSSLCELWAWLSATMRPGARLAAMKTVVSTDGGPACGLACSAAAQR